MAAAVELRDITKRFPGVVANDGVHFEAAEGEVHALLGENGAGKSTLSNILTGLYYPDDGQILTLFYKGEQTLDGQEALVYARTREPSGWSRRVRTITPKAQRTEAITSGIPSLVRPS